MVERQCVAGRPIKDYIMSDLLKKFDCDTTNDFVKIAIAVAGFYMGIFYRTYFFIYAFLWKNFENLYETNLAADLQF